MIFQLTMVIENRSRDVGGPFITIFHRRPSTPLPIAGRRLPQDHHHPTLSNSSLTPLLIVQYSLAMPPSSSTALRALSGYRRLFRARRQLFAGDTHALTQSKLAIRSEFHKHKHITGPPEHIESLLQMIDDAEDMLLHGIVRGEYNAQRNVVEVKIRPEQEMRMDSETLTHVDPITAETTIETGMPKIEITKSSQSNARTK